VKRQQRRGAYGDSDLSDTFWTEEERPESVEQPVAQRQVRRPLASTAQDDQLLFEQEILCDHRSHATGTAELRDDDGQVEQGEQEALHARESVGQTSGATQRCRRPGFRATIGISRRTTGSPEEAIQLRADVVACFVDAGKVRGEVLKICESVLETETLSDDDKYWVLATMAEACLGIGDSDRANRKLQEAFAVAPAQWMRESTQGQIDKLRSLMADSPLKFVRADRV